MFGVRSGTGVVVVVGRGGRRDRRRGRGGPGAGRGAGTRRGARAVVVVVVAGTRAAAGVLEGHEVWASARTSLVVSTIAPTARARTMTAAGPRRRRRTIHTRAMPAAMRKSASITNVSMLPPVKASEQFTRSEPYALKPPMLDLPRIPPPPPLSRPPAELPDPRESF